MSRHNHGVKLYRMEFTCRRCRKKTRVDRREGDEDMLPRGWQIRIIPNCGMTNYTSEEPNCKECSAIPDEGTRVRAPYHEATLEDDPEPQQQSIPGETKRTLDI